MHRDMFASVLVRQVFYVFGRFRQRIPGTPMFTVCFGFTLLGILVLSHFKICHNFKK